MELPRQGFLSAWRSITRQALWLIFHLTVYKKGASSIILDCNTQDIVLQQGYGTEQLFQGEERGLQGEVLVGPLFGVKREGQNLARDTVCKL